jgi:hypothetical protein
MAATKTDSRRETGMLDRPGMENCYQETIRYNGLRTESFGINGQVLADAR